MKCKIISFLVITIFLLMLSYGCLSSEKNDINSDSIEITDFNWCEYRGYIGILFEATVNLKNKENYQAYMYIDKTAEPYSDNSDNKKYIKLKSGDNLVTGIYEDFYKDFNPVEKGKLQLYIYSPTGKLITSKIIEKPYFDATITSNNEVIYSSDYFYSQDLGRFAGKKYLTIQNTGNLDADFRLDQRSKIFEDVDLCGVFPDEQYAIYLKPGETQQIELCVADSADNVDCKLLKRGETEISLGIYHNNDVHRDIKNYYELDSINFNWVYDE